MCNHFVEALFQCFFCVSDEIEEDELDCFLEQGAIACHSFWSFTGTASSRLSNLTSVRTLLSWLVLIHGDREMLLFWQFLAVFSVKDLFDLEVGEFSIVNAVLENLKDKGHDVVCFNVIRVLDVLLSNYMDDLFKATDMSHLEFIVRTILVLFRDENGSIVVESTDAIPSFVEGVQDS